MKYYNLHYFFDRKMQGSFVVETELELNNYKTEDEFLDALVKANDIKEEYAKQICKIDRIDERMFDKLK